MNYKKNLADLKVACTYIGKYHNKEGYLSYHFFNHNREELGYFIPDLGLDAVMLDIPRKWSEYFIKTLSWVNAGSFIG